MKILPVLLLCCCACVELPPGAAPGAAVPQPVEAPAGGLDPGAKTVETAHFKVQAYGSEAAAAHAAALENNYTRIMQDLGLYSFVPARPYNVTVYLDAAEYRAKSGMPEWSGGAAYGNALLLFEGENLAAVMAHEMTHLVFNEFMGLSQAQALRWLNEGAAVYQEGRSNTASASYYDGLLKNLVVRNPIPFSQMVNLAPQSENRAGVEAWYAQAGSVVSFLVRQGGSFNFSLFLGRLKGGADTDRALAEAYPGVWKNLSDVEKAWQLELARR
ncbi:MAG: peptidase MA family metallohydrolase [Elusimicrobiales bacterium]